MTTRKTKEEQRQIEQEKDEKRLAKEEQKKEERDAKFMSHFRQVDNTSHDISDRYTQLEHVLGNIHKFTDRGFSADGKLHPGDEFFIFINRDQNDYEVKKILYSDYDAENKTHLVRNNIGTKKEALTYKLNYRNLKEKGIEIEQYRVVKAEYDEETGLNCAIIQRIEEQNNGEILVKETILWADGSKGFNNFWEANGFKNKTTITKELWADWVKNNGATALGLINEQTGQIYKFAKEYMAIDEDGNVTNKIDVATGVSLAGLSMGTLGHTELFKDTKVKAHSGVPSYDLINEFTKPERTGENLTKKEEIENKLRMNNKLEGSNIEYYIIKNEILFQILRGYIEDKSKLFIKDESNYPDMTPHGPLCYNNIDGENGSYHQYKVVKDFLLWKIQPKHNPTPNTSNEKEKVSSFEEFISDPDKFVFEYNSPQGILGYKNNSDWSSIPDDIYKQEAQKYSDPLFMESYFSEVGEYGTLREKFKNGGSFHYNRNEKLEENLPPAERELSRLKRNVEKINETLEEMKEQLDYHEKVVNVYNCPELAEFYLHRPVRNIIADFLEDYCIMEGIDMTE